MTIQTNQHPPRRTGQANRPWRWLAALLPALVLCTGVASPVAAAEAYGARHISVFACPPAEVDEQFTDIDQNSHGFAIDCMATYGIADGTAPGTYSPGIAVTRGQMATFLYRLLDAAGVTMDTSDQGMNDVAGNAHEAHINAVLAAHVARGTSETTFSPQAPVTRAQMASLLANAVVIGGAFMDIGGNAFDDDDGNVHETAIDALAHNGITEGVALRRFAPGAVVRRDAMASLVMRAVDFAIEHGGMRSPFAENHRSAHLTPGQVATPEGGESDAEGHGEVWTVAQLDVLCFEMSTTGVGSGPDHPERVAYLALGATGEVGQILVELPPPSAANPVPPGVDAWSAGCVRVDTAIVRAVIEHPEDLYLGLATWEHEEAVRGQLQLPAGG